MISVGFPVVLYLWLWNTNSHKQEQMVSWWFYLFIYSCKIKWMPILFNREQKILSANSIDYVAQELKACSWTACWVLKPTSLLCIRCNSDPKNWHSTVDVYCLRVIYPCIKHCVQLHRGRFFISFCNFRHSCMYVIALQNECCAGHSRLIGVYVW